jgi:hypothetical protein
MRCAAVIHTVAARHTRLVLGTSRMNISQYANRLKRTKRMAVCAVSVFTKSAAVPNGAGKFLVLIIGAEPVRTVCPWFQR